MTSAPDDPPDSELSRALCCVGTCVGTALRAALDGDRDAARQVLRDGHRRRTLVRRAHDAAVRLSAGEVSHRRATAALMLVADVDQVSRLVDRLARHVCREDVPAELTEQRREALLLLARHGEERLRQLATGPVGPELGHDYVRCGQCLFAVLDRLEDHLADDAASACCAALTESILQASRHATSAA